MLRLVGDQASLAFATKCKQIFGARYRECAKLTILSFPEKSMLLAVASLLCWPICFQMLSSAWFDLRDRRLIVRMMIVWLT